MADENGKDLVDETTDKAGDIVDKGKEMASDAADAVKDAAGAVADKGKDIAGDVAGSVGDAAEKGKEVIGDAAGAVAGAAGSAAGKGKEFVGDAAGAVSDAAGAAKDKVGDAFGSVTEAFDGDGDGDSGSVLKWLLPLLLLGLLLVLLFMFFNRSGAENPATNTNADNTNTEASQPTGEAVESSVSVEAKDGKYAITGSVPDEETKTNIQKEAEAVWGAGNVDVSGLTVNANAKLKDGWWEGFKSLLPSLKDWKTGSISWADGAIKTVGEIPTEVADKIKSLFGGWSLPMSIGGEEGAAKAANEKALALLADADSVEKVVAGLNAAIINFASGKSDVPADAKAVIEKAAEVLKKQPEGTVIEIGGHTDNVGDAAANAALSAARAESVKKALVGLGVSEKMLLSKGYGDTVKKAENDTEEGRFANRRIEYKVGGGDNPAADTGSAPAGDKPAPGN